MVSLVRTGESFWAECFDKADVVSEGSVELEDDGWVYRGSTSIILRCVANHIASGETLEGPWGRDQEERLRSMALDPHLRLRAVRVARREAQARTPGMLDTVHSDLLVRAEGGQVRIDVDIEGAVVVAEGRNGRHLERKANGA